MGIGRCGRHLGPAPLPVGGRRGRHDLDPFHRLRNGHNDALLHDALGVRVGGLFPGVVIVEVEVFARLRGARVRRVDPGVVATTMGRNTRGVSAQLESESGFGAQAPLTSVFGTLVAPRRCTTTSIGHHAGALMMMLMILVVCVRRCR